MPSPAVDPDPETLGEFEIEKRLGGGGMGVVYLARQPSLNRWVALKTVRPEDRHFAGFRTRFRREVEAVARLEHPGLVRVYESGVGHGIPYYTMEWVRGTDLASVLRHLRGRDPRSLRARDLIAAAAALSPQGTPFEAVRDRSWVEVSVDIARQLAQALEHAHGQGVFHRDIKPSNVMITPQGRAVLIDFGLARAAGSPSITRLGSHVGSLAYSSPEQANGTGDPIDPRSDVYSLGATLYELLTLRPAFAGDAASPGERTPRERTLRESTLRERIDSGSKIAPRDANPALSPDAETILLTAMEPDLRDRYASASDLHLDLGRLLALEPIRARRAGKWERLTRSARRRPLATLLLLACLLIVGLGLRTWMLEGRLDEARGILGKAVETEGKTRATLGDRRDDLSVFIAHREVMWLREQLPLTVSLGDAEAMDRWLSRAGGVLYGPPLPHPDPSREGSWSDYERMLSGMASEVDAVRQLELPDWIVQVARRRKGWAQEQEPTGQRSGTDDR